MKLTSGQGPHHNDIQTLYDVPDADLVTGGFPCQSYSSVGIGKRKSLGMKVGFEAQEGQLWNHLVHVVENSKCKAVLFENVLGLRSHDGGMTLQLMLDDLQRLGFHSHVVTANALDFVPQSRRRLFIVGIKDTMFSQDYVTPSAPTTRIALSDILEREVDDKYYLPPSRVEWVYYRNKRNKDKGLNFQITILTPDSDAVPTITAHESKGPGFVLKLGDKMRLLTPRELLRCFGFPDTFTIDQSEFQTRRLIGNSVCVPLVRSILSRMIPLL